MGIDSIKLFDKTLADQILAMERQSLTRFLEGNIGVLRQKDFTLNPVLYKMEQTGGSVSDALESLLSDEYTLTGLKTEVAQDFAFGMRRYILIIGAVTRRFLSGTPKALSQVSIICRVRKRRYFSCCAPIM
jgi:hypothetical protein